MYIPLQQRSGDFRFIVCSVAMLGDDLAQVHPSDFGQHFPPLLRGLFQVLTVMIYSSKAYMPLQFTTSKPLTN